jgi:hypothetical protein
MAAALIAALLLQAAPPARPPASSADLPPWSKTPTAEEVKAAYPPEALKLNLAGSGTIECTVGASGELTACVPVSETPAGAGFGAAALTIAGKFQMPVRSPSGASTVGRTVRVPIGWVNPPESQAPLITLPDDIGRRGRVVFNCRVREDRGVDNCMFVEAQPPGSPLMTLASEPIQRLRVTGKSKSGARVIVAVEFDPRRRR